MKEPPHKLVFNIKRKLGSSIDRYKARIVTRGHRSIYRFLLHRFHTIGEATLWGDDSVKPRLN